MGIRVATFNCENLFSRAKLLNFEDNAEAKPYLNKLVRLQDLICRVKYTEAAKKEILELLGELKDYVTLVELRGKLLTTKQGKRVVGPDGRGDWEGGIELKRDRLPIRAQKSTARVVNEVGADVICLVEVEDRFILDSFNKDLLDPAYGWDMLIDGNDERGIDLGVLSRFPLGNLRSHIHDADGKRRIFSRDCLEVELRLPDGRSLWILLNHFKSKGYGSPASNDARRKAQAARVAEILKGFDLKNDLVVVAGDLNDTPDSDPLKPLTSISLLHDVLDRLTDGEPRWTYGKGKKQIDYLLVSQPLFDSVSEVGIERRGLLKGGGLVEPFDTVEDDLTDASDHCAVWANFDV